MSFLDRIRACSAGDLSGYLPFRLDGLGIGHVRPGFAEVLAGHPEVFDVSADAVALRPDLDSPETRTKAVDGVLRTLAKRGLIPDWRDEPFAVKTHFAAPELFVMERAAVSRFGIKAWGLHVNGFVRTGEGLKMWVGRRASDRAVSPGKLDHLVAGGQPAGLSLSENLVKECAEEAALPRELALRAKPVGGVTYRLETERGLRDDVLFVYDLELPADFVPRNTDGEVAEFQLWPVEKVMETVRDTDDYKFNCSVVVIDFLIRHGLIGPEHPDYEALLAGVRQG